MTFPLDFEALFEVTPLPLLVLATDAPRYTIVAANDAYFEMTMANRDGFVGQGAFEVFPDDGCGEGAEVMRASLDAAVQTGEPQHLEALRYAVPGPDGQEMVLFWDALNRAIPPKKPGEKPAYLLHTVTNVTERVRAGQREVAQAERVQVAAAEQHRAEEEAADLQRIIDTVQAGIFIFTPVRDESGAITDFRFRTANRAMAHYFNQASEVVTGKLGSDYFSDYKANGLFERYRETAATGVSDRFEFHYDGDGIDVWLDIMSTRLSETTQEVLVSFTDHTELRRTKDRLEKMVSDLRRSNTSLEEFAYVASHDLQEPLRKIQAFGDMLQGRYSGALGPGGGTLVERMQAAAERMRILIEDLLTYSRLSARPTGVRPVDTGAVLRDVLNDLEAAVKERNAIVTWEGIEPVQGDPLQLRQLFQNLVGNALKFSKPDEPPRISIDGQETSGAEAGFEPGTPESRRAYLRIDVRDNGIGFEPEYAHRIFQIFQRLHGRTEVPGTGVGLSIVQKVVENHHGRIVAASVPGEGATFTVWLPLAEAPVAPEADGAGAAA